MTRAINHLHIASSKTIHAETGIEDNGPKNTKISMITRLQRIHDRIDLLENHKIKDIEKLIADQRRDYEAIIHDHELRICELSTYNGETQEILRLLDTALRVIVHTLAENGIPIETKVPLVDTPATNKPGHMY